MASAMIRLLPILIFATLTSTCDAMMSTYIFMEVSRVDDPAVSTRLCANFHPVFPKSAFPARNLNKATPLRMEYLNEIYPITGNVSLSGSIIHTCSYDQFGGGVCPDKPTGVNKRIDYLQSHNASAILFVTTPYRTHASFYDPRINDSLVSVPIYYVDENIDEALYAVLNSSASSYVLRFFIPEDPVVDGAMVLILIIAVTCVAIGGAWSGRKHYDLFKAETNRLLVGSLAEGSTRSQHVETREEAARTRVPDKSAPSAGADGSISQSAELAAAPFTWITLILFVVVIVGFLMLLYYAYNAVVWLVIVLFVIASSCSMRECIWYFVSKIPVGKSSFRLDCIANLLERICRCWKWSMLRISIEYRHAALYFFCATVAITWCIFRHWSYAFILHDMLAMCFSIVTIRNLRLPNLMWITALLSLLLFYDLFMVFITPFITKSGCSVMIDVATGGSCSRSNAATDATHNLPPSNGTKEELPIVIRVPRFNDPLRSCYRMDVDVQYPPVILGLGDIILPGVLVGFNQAFSLATRTPYHLYYIIGVVGYTLGMIFTFAALLLSKLPQPALIYLVPFVLIPTHITALVRKEWKKMWKGQFPLTEDACPIMKQGGSGQATSDGRLLNPAADTGVSNQDGNAV